MGKRVLFFRFLVSARKWHSSGVRSLVVRCLLFNPEGSCSNPCVCANFVYKYSEAEVSHFFGTMRLPLSRFVTLFSNIFNVSNNRTNVKKSQRVPSFRFFGTMRLLKFSFFVFFSKIFQSLQRVPLQFFFNFATMDVKKISKSPPFTVFGIVRFF